MITRVSFRRFRGFLLLGHLPALAQLVGDGFQARRRLGGSFDVVVDLGGLLHDLATHREVGGNGEKSMLQNCQSIVGSMADLCFPAWIWRRWSEGNLFISRSALLIIEFYKIPFRFTNTKSCLVGLRQSFARWFGYP